MNMQKRVKMVCIAIVCMLIVITFIVIDNKDNKKTFKQDGVTYALTLDGKSTNGFPSKGLYKASVTCENATGKWLYDEWKLAI